MTKTAQVPTPKSRRGPSAGVPVPRSKRTAPAATTQTAPASYVASGSPSAAVKQMQMAILTFAQVLSEHPVMSMQNTGQQENPKRSGDYLGGTTAFGNFLVNQYANNANVVGQQYVNIDLPEPQRSDTARPNVNLKGIINTIGHIGTPGSENKPDGIWQTRTNNALKQIYAVGMSLMKFATDMKLSVSDFSDKDLEAFKELIPASYTELKGNVSDRAATITKYIDALTTLYGKFETTVLEHPEFKALIGQEKPFMDHAKNVATELSQEEQALYNGNKDAIIPGANVNGKPVRLMDVISMTAFKKFLQAANVDISKPEEVQKHIAEVKASLSSSGTDLGPGF